MTKKADGRDAEMDALLQVENVDTEAITAQINKSKGIEPDEKPPDGKPPEPKPGDPKPADPKPGDNKPPDQKSVSDIETIRTGILSEMFGDQFKTVDDVKKANIPEALKELPTLRQKVQELSDSLAKKPKHNFASDDIAKFNEFARETGIKDATVFNKLNAVELANMPDIDALSLQHVIENPRLAGKAPEEIRRYFERKYNLDATKIDPKRVDSGDLTQEELEANKREYEDNKMDMELDAEKAKTKLAELKSKIKMPEIPADEPDIKSKWTPEVEKTQKEAWTKVNEKMGEEFSKIPITLKGAKEPIVNFVLPEEAKKLVLQNAIDYVVSNHLEVSKENVTSVASSMYSDILFTHREEIYHAIFERARSLTEEELLRVYHNPSSKNNDNAPGKGELTKDEEDRQKAYELETGKK